MRQRLQVLRRRVLRSPRIRLPLRRFGLIHRRHGCARSDRGHDFPDSNERHERDFPLRDANQRDTHRIRRQHAFRIYDRFDWHKRKRWKFCTPFSDPSSSRPGIERTFQYKNHFDCWTKRHHSNRFKRIGNKHHLPEHLPDWRSQSWRVARCWSNRSVAHLGSISRRGATKSCELGLHLVLK